MSLAIKYETVEDATMRLRNTVVLYKGEPVFIVDVRKGEGKDDIFRVLIRELPFEKGIVMPGRPHPFRDQKEPEVERKYISSKHFDIAPFPMGYVNRNKGAFYCGRMPSRMQKQGLCAENFKGKDNQGLNIPFQEFLESVGVKGMVQGLYPSITEAKRMLRDQHSVAFDRQFCLTKDEIIPELIFLYYKGNKVGLLKNDTVMLGNKYLCLTERLDEMKLRAGAL